MPNNATAMARFMIIPPKDKAARYRTPLRMSPADPLHTTVTDRHLMITSDVVADDPFEAKADIH